MGEARNKKLNEIAELQQKAVELELEEAAIIAQFTPEELLVVWNGIGPEWLPNEIRSRLTKYLAIFASACLIHDFHYWALGSSRAEFDWANDVLERNARRCIDGATRWYQIIRRAAGYYAAHLLAQACRRYGWSAFLSGRVEEVKSDGVRSDGVNSSTPSLPHSPTKLSLCISASVLILLSGCYRSITVSRTDEWNLTYRSVGLKTDVSKIEAEKAADGTVRVLVEGIATDVSERNAAIVESSGTAIGNIIEGAK